MLRDLFRRRAKPGPPTVKRLARVPDGVRVYAVGDVHGRVDLLDELIAMISADNSRRQVAEVHLVMLGDLIDRGPDSAAVIERMTERPGGIDRLHLLRGNHEDSFLTIIDGDRTELGGWLRYGGAETLTSYGISQRAASIPGPFFDSEIAARVPASHLALMRAMHDSIQIGDYLFVHAGIRPGVPLMRQDARDLYWIRDEFLHSEIDHGITVVHGHSMRQNVEELWNRIGVDTGAYATGRLTALALEGGERWFLTTAPRPGDAVLENDIDPR